MPWEPGNHSFLSASANASLTENITSRVHGQVGSVAVAERTDLVAAVLTGVVLGVIICMTVSNCKHILQEGLDSYMYNYFV